MPGAVARTGPVVRAPASSANLGPGFDTLGLAVDLPFEIRLAEPRTDAEPATNDSFLVVERTHPAGIAFTSAGGPVGTELLWRSPIPPGRGLGFSGAARVAGAYLGALTTGVTHDDAVDVAFSVAAELEGHADNAAASAYGGLCIAGGFGGVRVTVPERFLEKLDTIVWSPSSTTSTSAARTRLPEQIPLSTAVASIERTALWVAAMVGGSTDLLREACRDDLHQPSRLRRAPASAVVLERMLDDPLVLAAWLSGSGPSVAALVRASDATTVLSAAGRDLPDGQVRRLGIATTGVHVSDPGWIPVTV